MHRRCISNWKGKKAYFCADFGQRFIFFDVSPAMGGGKEALLAVWLELLCFFLAQHFLVDLAKILWYHLIKPLRGVA